MASTSSVVMSALNTVNVTDFSVLKGPLFAVSGMVICFWKIGFI
ncbi:hypothetical protein MGSAQ_001700 [marine sediment metagenome]|uniref:Uncharacterized protein n=1 Tax=marine sediment metagenome TaxID=412755 RepID=A0A1B6NTJ8_9ZZZZ